jgi:hypothetical protein
MPDGNDGNDKPAIIDLVNDAVIADPDAVQPTRTLCNKASGYPDVRGKSFFEGLRKKISVFHCRRTANFLIFFTQKKEIIISGTV